MLIKTSTRNLSRSNLVIPIYSINLLPISGNVFGLLGSMIYILCSFTSDVSWICIKFLLVASAKHYAHNIPYIMIACFWELTIKLTAITHRNNYLFHVKSDFSLYSMPFTYRVDVFFSMLYERIILKLSIYPCYRCIRDQNLVTMSYTLSIVH